jgi:hypothetical protein
MKIVKSKIPALFGAWAMTMPWGTVLVLPEQVENEKLLRHEQVHLMQISRDGAIVWTLKYLFYLIRHGYQNSPYEVEARRIAGI